jgi:hypothetical protein
MFFVVILQHCEPLFSKWQGVVDLDGRGFAHDQVHHTLDGDVQGIDLVHLLELPHLALAMPSIAGALVAVFAQGHHGVLAVLLDVVGVAWGWCVAYAARELFDQPHVCALFGGECVVHA